MEIRITIHAHKDEYHKESKLLSRIPQGSVDLIEEIFSKFFLLYNGVTGHQYTEITCEWDNESRTIGLQGNATSIDRFISNIIHNHIADNEEHDDDCHDCESLHFHPEIYYERD